MTFATFKRMLSHHECHLLLLSPVVHAVSINILNVVMWPPLWLV